MELINNLVGIVVATTVFTMVLLPLIIWVEGLVCKWITYSTAGEVSFRSPLAKLWDKTLAFKHGSYVYQNDLEAAVIVGYIVVYSVGVGVIGALVFDHGYMFLEAVSRIFYTVSKYASDLSPVALCVGAFISVSIGSRKLFTFKREVEGKLKEVKQ